MNSTWNKNIASFKIRFPQLFQMMESDILKFENGQTKSPLEIVDAKNGEPTALENKIPLHSKYNPSREISQLIEKISPDSNAAIFLGFGLGYGPIEFAKKYPSIPLIIIEENPLYVFTAFSVLDWESVFRHEKVIFVIGADSTSASNLALTFGNDNLQFFSNKSQTSHAQDYFDEIKSLCNRAKQKDEINTNTLEKFSHLWLRNSCKNLPHLESKKGVADYFNLCQNQKIGDLPFVVIAAGPSLENILPHLAELKKRSVLVCVDTALKACLEVGVEPDFIVLVDPQYACALHLEFLESPSSILITESAAWPSVFRFKCKEIIMCSSLFPVGQFFEKQLGNKGELGAGGSVTTTSWDFSRKCGAKRIYIAGMDLGFPGRQTHIRGSQFEERSHRTSNRLSTGETDGINALLGANPKVAKDYDGNDILTDTRMSMFSWWFQRSTETANLDGQKTFTLTSQSLNIPGIVKADVRDLLSEDDRTETKKEFFRLAMDKSQSSEKKSVSYKEVLENFRSNLDQLEELSKKGLQLCKSGLENPSRAQEFFTKLQDIDDQIMGSKAKDAAALVFPTKRQLDKLSKDLPQEGVLAPLYFSRLIYTQIQKAVREFLEELEG